MKNKQINRLEVNVGPQVNCPDAVESIKINNTTEFHCNCSEASIIITEQRFDFFRCKFRSISLYVSPSVLLSDLSWTFSSTSAPVVHVAMLLQLLEES